MIEQTYPGVAQLVARLTGGQEAVSSSLATRTSKKPWNDVDTLFQGFLLFRIAPIVPKKGWK